MKKSYDIHYITFSPHTAAITNTYLHLFVLVRMLAFNDPDMNCHVHEQDFFIKLFRSRTDLQEGAWLSDYICQCNKAQFSANRVVEWLI